MAATVFYIFIIGILTFFTRAKAIRSKKLSLGYFKTHDLKSYEAPENIVRYGRHFDNQFQVPMLFMFTLLTTGIYTPENKTVFGLAWFFLITRIIHSYIHLGKNNIILRARAYFAGWIVLILMWTVIVYKSAGA
jgi:hypothetical protein